MPYDDPDPTDPMTLHSVAVPTHDPHAMRHMAECFIEEYFRLGFDPQRIARMFHHPGYAGPFLALVTLGEQAIGALIDDAAAIWNRGPAPVAQRSEHGMLSLQVLEM